MEQDPRAAVGAHRPRPLNQPTPVDVRLGRGRLPRAVRLPGMHGPSAVRDRWREVAGVDEVWRVDDEWWRPRPVSRRYVRCSLDDGTCLTLYEDLLDGTWWRQRA